jgi:hypothetical protein
LSGERRASRPQKTTLTCKTCGVTNSFYSSIGAKQFSLKHMGHELVETEAGASEEWRDDRFVHEELPSFDKPAAVKLPKIVVELVTFPALSKPVFRICGINKDNEEAFVQVLVQEQAERVRETLARGQLVDQGPGGQLFMWDPEAIEFTEAAKRNLRMPARMGESRSVESETAQRYDASMARRMTEPVLKPPPSKEAEEADDRVFPSARPSGPREVELDDTVRASNESIPSVQSGQDLKNAPPMPAQQTTEPAGELELEPEATVQRAPPKESPPAAKEEESDMPLLVSKSWYVQEGKKNEKEAARISKVLRAFRWRIEPAYTIRLIMDDILSIESSKNEISGGLTKRIESAGYRLSAVTSEQGNLVAWFKRIPNLDASPSTEPAESSKRRARAAAAKKAEASDQSAAPEEEDVDL